jgi:hypothetical protein
MATTALPQVINNLISTFGASSALSGVRIFDGPEVDSSYPGDWIAVGHDGSDDGEVTVSSVSQVYELLGGMAMFEDGTVDCVFCVWDGGTDLSAKRTRAGVILSAIDTAIRANANLSGACLYSRLSSHDMTYLQTNAGAGVSVRFSIDYRAKI